MKLNYTETESPISFRAHLRLPLAAQLSFPSSLSFILLADSSSSRNFIFFSQLDNNNYSVNEIPSSYETLTRLVKMEDNSQRRTNCCGSCHSQRNNLDCAKHLIIPFINTS
ncbi:hypothetical protein P8452_66936 [Trifolium repens]|nr:hypothetical protein P8452_66936 [Trifolium repens]